MSRQIEKGLGESKLKDSPKKKLKFTIAPKAITESKVADDAISWRTLTPDLKNQLNSMMSRIRALERFHKNDPYVPEENVWFVGQITKKSYKFSELTLVQLLSVSQAVPLETKEAVFVINESCWFAMVPEGTEIEGACYTDGGFVSNFTKEEIENGFISGVTHSDVVINDRVYHVYVNRNAGLEGAGVEGRFRIK